MITLEEIHQRIPGDHMRQVDAEYYLQALGRAEDTSVLDVGAGDGRSFDIARRHFSNLKWIGLDILDSPEVRDRKRTDCEFMSYDGVNIPSESEMFDIVYSRQVFEHVRYPETVMKEICRVLKPGGHFVGSVSQMEPYHSYSLWNFTYYGFAVLAEAAGLSLVEFRPGIDGLALTLRNLTLFGLKHRISEIFLPMFGDDSPLNVILENSGRKMGYDTRGINRLKIAYCGHLCFVFRKPC